MAQNDIHAAKKRRATCLFAAPLGHARPCCCSAVRLCPVAFFVVAPLPRFRVGAPLPPDMWNQITQPSGDEEEEEEEEEEEAAEPPLRRHSVLWN